MKEFGEFLGIIIIVLYALTVSRYLFRLVNSKFQKQIVKNERFYVIYKKVMKFIVLNHVVFGSLTILFIFTHFVQQFINYGISISGIVAASLMLLQIILGFYGAYASNKWKYWKYLHKILAIVILLAILIHIV